jgi:EAL domain-containing protein (putative c-di-GMP-specific phosphodiesterase class I)
VALSQAADSDADSLLRDADTAMYAAKRSGRSRYAIFDAGMRATALARMDIESGLRSGLGRGEFFAHYQPIFDLHTGRAVAAEALMRWQRPTGPLVGPDGFLEVAEQTGLITTLGRHVTLTACRQVAQWRGDGMPDLTLSLNVSPQQLALTNFSDQFIELLGEADLSPEAVMLEITEHTLMLANTDDLERLRERGVRIAPDDFGTGFSSLAYLQRLPVDVLKTDRTFLAHSNADGGRLLGSIIRLAEALELRLVVEGVETGAELRRLLSCGGHLAQGYGLARPGPASTLHERAEMTPSI